ncbi:MAG TPA: TetR/AcrR family transcriptional regulator [Woeseiaceae bacterium]|jgi:AcrR family transcriptional regulator|nr:TetR/AcrR family transcriptional regulator [Woeseiaceae bacterium]
MRSNDRILPAAATLFRQHGVSGTTIRAIAEAAEMLPGSVTYRYPTKESLVVALMEKAVAQVSSEVLAAVEYVQDPIERLRLAMRAHLRVLLGGDDAVYVLLFDWRRLPAATRQQLSSERHRYESIWDGLIYAAAASGQLVPGLDLVLVRKFAFGAANSVAFWYRPDGSRTPDEIADAFSVLIGLGALSEGARSPVSIDMYREVGALRTVMETTDSSGDVHA